jgi:transcriptional regulator with XRE-family HTH domain
MTTEPVDHPPLTQTLAKNLRSARRLRQLSIDALASRCGYTTQFLASLERASLSGEDIGMVDLETLAAALHIDLVDLLKPVPVGEPA